MTTTTAAPAPATSSKIDELLRKVFVVINDNLWSVITTIVFFGLAAGTYFSINPLHSAWAISVTFFIYLDLLAIRITRSFDDSYTLNELAERIIEWEESSNERLDRIEKQL